MTRRSGFAPPPTPRTGSLPLDCPECATPIRIPARDLVEGAAIHCDHCGADAELTHEFDLAAGKNHWLLVDPEAEDDGSEARR